MHMLHQQDQPEIATLAETVLPQAEASPLREMLASRRATPRPRRSRSPRHLKAAIEPLVLQGNVKALPDGKPYLFSDGIKSLELGVGFGADAGVTLKVNEGQ
jgi:hypothetical protein